MKKRNKIKKFEGLLLIVKKKELNYIVKIIFVYIFI